MINTVGIYMAVAVDIVWKNRRALTKSQGLFLCAFELLQRILNLLQIVKKYFVEQNILFLNYTGLSGRDH